MKNHLRQNRAITLIALVITIIVLLILAGVTIASLTGENGLLERTATTREKTDEGRVLDEIGLAWHDVQIDGLREGWDNDRKATELATKLGNGATATASGDTITVKYNGYTATINTVTGQTTANKDSGGSKTAIEVGGTAISGSSIANVNEALKADYGKNTNYTSVTGVTWQLFYDDPTNIYLIASDYVPGNTLPNELLTDGQYTTYCRKFATGSSDTTSPIPAGTPWKDASSASTVQNNPYLKWVGSSVDNKSNKYINMKAVAYMMDTSKWSNFAGSASGATAIGGPTVEMFALSYNAQHSTNQIGTYGTSVADITIDNADVEGYKVKIGETGTWDNTLGGLGSNNMWVIEGFTKAYQYWLASPSSQSQEYLNIAFFPMGRRYWRCCRQQRLDRVPSISFYSKI